MASTAGIDFLDHLSRESARFAKVMAATAAADPVPSCPGWNADDLLWHLGEVQWFWGSIVAQGVTSTDRAEALRARRPAGRAELAEFFAAASRTLGAVLAASPPGTPAWTWSEDHSVGFIRRRQAHEALIHRLDAELTAGHRTAMDPRLSADGVDEALRIMYGGDVPRWGHFEPAGGRALRIVASDTGGSWLVTLGRFAGTDPGSGTSYDEAGIQVAAADSGTPAAASVMARAADLDCWLWRRPTAAQVDRSGNSAVLDGFDQVIAAGIS